MYSLFDRFYTLFSLTFALSNIVACLLFWSHLYPVCMSFENKQNKWISHTKRWHGWPCCASCLSSSASFPPRSCSHHFNLSHPFSATISLVWWCNVRLGCRVHIYGSFAFSFVAAIILRSPTRDDGQNTKEIVRNPSGTIRTPRAIFKEKTNIKRE